MRLGGGVSDVEGSVGALLPIASVVGAPPEMYALPLGTSASPVGVVMWCGVCCDAE